MFLSQKIKGLGLEILQNVGWLRSFDEDCQPGEEFSTNFGILQEGYRCALLYATSTRIIRDFMPSNGYFIRPMRLCLFL